jgi:anti-sigma factor RsiW
MKGWLRRGGPGHAPSCREVGRLLQAYLDGQVDEVTTHRVAQHLEDCRRCGLEASTYRELKASLARSAPRLDRTAVERLRAFGASLSEQGPSAAEPGTGDSAS